MRDDEIVSLADWMPGQSRAEHLSRWAMRLKEQMTDLSSDKAMRLAPLSENMLAVVAANGKWLVMDKRTDKVLSVCDSNSAAWRWIDRNSGAGQADYDQHYRIRNSERFS